MTLDADGAEMLYPAVAGGSSFRLGERRSCDDPKHLDYWAATLTVDTGGRMRHWRSTGKPVKCASGKAAGMSRRLIIDGGGTQRYNWRNGAIDHGYCESPTDLDAFEQLAALSVELVECGGLVRPTDVAMGDYTQVARGRAG